ncbi:MAG: phosphatidylserine decarboxylase family protein [Desulfatiglandales bacterium]
MGLREMRPPVAKEGLIFILPYWAFLFLLLVLGQSLLSAALSFVGLLLIWFFRDPERISREVPEAILAPADGKVVEVKRAVIINEIPMQKISIFMSVFDVHINRSPVEGQVVGNQCFKGKFFPADEDKSSELNERNMLTIRTLKGEIVYVVQIAGFIARRISSWAKVGDMLKRGQRIGIIRFGSRVDMYMPLNWEIAISKGKRTKAGKTVVGYMR